MCLAAAFEGWRSTAVILQLSSGKEFRLRLRLESLVLERTFDAWAASAEDVATERSHSLPNTATLGSLPFSLSVLDRFVQQHNEHVPNREKLDADAKGKKETVAAQTKRERRLSEAAFRRGQRADWRWCGELWRRWASCAKYAVRGQAAADLQVTQLKPAVVGAVAALSHNCGSKFRRRWRSSTSCDSRHSRRRRRLARADSPSR